MPLVASIACLALPACAAYPERAIHLIVPFGPGSAPDILARLLADRLSPRLGAPWVVENVPGAAGTLGVDRVVKAPPDGYTLVLSGDAALVATGAAAIKPPYDPLADLAPITQLVVTPNVLVVGNAVAASTVGGLIALMRSRPGDFNCAHVGVGTSSQRACDLLGTSAGLDFVQVPFTQSPLLDVEADRVQIFFANIATAMPLARAGRLKALAVSSLSRSPAAPTLPTLAESGLPGFEAVAWFGLLAPAGLPDPVMQRLQSETRQALQEPAFKTRLVELGMTPVGGSPAEFGALIRAETRRRSDALPAASAPSRRPSAAASGVSP